MISRPGHLRPGAASRGALGEQARGVKGGLAAARALSSLAHAERAASARTQGRISEHVSVGGL